MPFTNPDFPGQTFRTVEEYDEARKKRRDIEKTLAARSEEEITSVTAVLIPASQGLLESKVAQLEAQLGDLQTQLRGLLSQAPAAPQRMVNDEGLKIGSVLHGESKGREYTLEVLEKGYLCSDGQIYQSLSGAALGVSGNRRSGWKFWRAQNGSSVGEESGRFLIHVGNNPFHS